jgi:hypothetical protein
MENKATDLTYFVIRNKKTGLYFRGKGVNRWGEYFNQATIYRVRGTADNSCEELKHRGEESEVLPIKITFIEETPKVEVSDTEYFTPEQVSRMSHKEIRENYSKILKSMSKWT